MLLLLVPGHLPLPRRRLRKSYLPATLNLALDAEAGRPLKGIRSRIYVAVPGALTRAV
eukprot:COSAG06_NODE_38097_length_427_cov_1.091463_1_plen_57_part_10